MSRAHRLAVAALALSVLAGALTLMASPGLAEIRPPGDILDLGRWKLTLPTGPVDKASEVLQPGLGTFIDYRWFLSTAAEDAVRLRAPVACTPAATGPFCGSRTSLNTRYARSELREMNPDGSRAAWSTTSGVHTMEARFAFTRLPETKPHLVAMQVHGADDDVTTIRLEGNTLWATDGDNPHYQVLDDDYELNTPVTIRYVARDGSIRVYYEGALKATVESASTGDYFKAGAYTQANCDNSTPCDGRVNYGAVMFYSLRVAHQ